MPATKTQSLKELFIFLNFCLLTPAFASACFLAFCLASCGDDNSSNNNNNPPVDSNVVLRVDSVVLNTSNNLFVQQTFNFSKKLRSIDFQYWGESNVPAINGPYIMLMFRSDLGDSVSFTQSGNNIDSLSKKIFGSFSFSLGDSCNIVKIQLSMFDTIPQPVSKYVKLRTLKIYSF